MHGGGALMSRGLGYVAQGRGSAGLGGFERRGRGRDEAHRGGEGWRGSVGCDLEMGLMVVVKLSRGRAAMIVSWGKRNGSVVVDGCVAAMYVVAQNWVW
ncbi:hypothetical protein M0R45_025488 [Rubus argutus]|uniref:Uncharacterized protein n=1 Tax=Rubus argutus TaxID=59490 RepID=A0AAW1WWE4_RUBAR